MKTRRFRLLARTALSALFFALACRGEGGTGLPEEELSAPGSVIVSPGLVTVDALGETVQFSAAVFDQLGRPLLDAPVTWYTSDEGIATIDSVGMATSTGDGTATILAAASPSVFGWGEMTVAAKPPSIISVGLRPAVVGIPYSQTLLAQGVTTAVWTVSQGTLPDGLALNETTGEISGIPTTPGESLFSVTLAGKSGSVTKDFVLVVARGDLGIGFDEDQFALIPDGSFQMGSEKGAARERPVHTVNITQPFLMQKTEVTQYQWRSVMGDNPSGSPNCGDVCPVEGVYWGNAQAFIDSLNVLDPGKGYRLPTEAEWEYAARAGTTGDYGGTGVLEEMGWYIGNSGGRTQLVGQKEPNAWGLYDMHGNVSEWVQDWYSESYYSVSPADDPQGPATGTLKVYRGGDMDDPDYRATSWARAANPAAVLIFTRGFRLVRNPG